MLLAFAFIQLVMISATGNSSDETRGQVAGAALFHFHYDYSFTEGQRRERCAQSHTAASGRLDRNPGRELWQQLRDSSVPT